MRPGKIVLVVLGVVVGLAAVAFLAGGGGLIWAQATQRDAGGFFTSPTIGLSTDSYAITAPQIDLGSQPGDWLPSGRLATVRIAVEPESGDSVFVGIGPTDDVEIYLDGVAREQVTEIGLGGEVTYRSLNGEAPAAAPSEQPFWAASDEGTATQTFTWDLEPGEWTVVVMNADAGQGVAVDASAGARTDLVVAVGTALLICGLVLGTLAAFMMVMAFRQTREVPASDVAATPAGFGPYPVRLEGRLDHELSRWQWLVKWVLAIPHYIILAFLWLAFSVVTLFAFFAILFTGSYPRALFEFNVGVMRWTWRVGYYSYSALGTDQYPPFTLADVDYPATFDVAYPAQLSRGLIFVKWLLAIPHFLIVGLFTSGLVWWTTELGGAGDPVLEIGGGLIGLLVLIAGFALLFVGRYPEGLFDLVMGLNRWVFRVGAYAALMRDEYPPYRLDTGGSEPGVVPPTPPSAPPKGGAVRSDADLGRV